MENQNEDIMYLESAIWQWDKFTLYLFWMNKLFSYLDRLYLKNQKTTVVING